MTDTVSKKKRSEIMGKVRGKNTRPEKKIRSLLHRLGYRFRIHVKELPGTPDIVLPKHRTVLFVHGCFWHRHTNCKYSTTPSTNVEFWKEKFNQNIERDKERQKELRNLGWRVIIVWQCELKELETLQSKLIKEIESGND